jgi:uncharacterized protein (TIGR02391 family)
MANDNSNKAYPRIPSKNWWDLREKAIQSPPKQITASYLQTILEISEGTAKNLLPGLRTVGLIDDNGESTPLMNDWRDNEHYPEVCKKIIEKIYPEELRSALPGPKQDRNQVKRWFARQTNTGEAAANQMAAFYMLLCEGDEIRQATRELYQNGYYALAVEECYKCLCNLVKNRSKLLGKSGKPLDGWDLMVQAFDEKNPILALNALKTESDENEQRGYRFIFAGVMAGIRNPRAHHHAYMDDADRALEMLAWGNHLAAKLKAAKKKSRKKFP